MASRIVFLAVGLGLGFGLGFLLRDEPDSGRAPPPRVVHEVVTVREPAPPPDDPDSRIETVAVPARPLPEAAAPDSPFPEGEEPAPGVGRLVVDFRGTGWPEPRIHVEGRLLEGGRVRFKVEADEDGIAEVELLAGTHTISWAEGEDSTRQRVLNVTIREGWLTRVDVTDPDLPRLDPIRDGLGRLEVSVADIGGGPLQDTPVSLWGREFHGGGETLDRTTNEAGRVRFDVLPGRYLFRVGLREEWAVVRAAQRTMLDVHYRNEGELRVEGELAGAVGIQALDLGRYARLTGKRWGSAVAQWRFVYLPPGEYRVTYQNGHRVAGRATVRSRQVTRFSHDPPTGALQLHIVLPESRKRQHLGVRVLDAVTGSVVGRKHTFIRDGLTYRLTDLQPGRYRVQITGRTFEIHEEEVIVGTTPVDRRVELVAKDP